MKERKGFSPQLSFGQTEEGGVFVPENVLDRAWGSEVMKFLEGRTNWKNRPSGLALGFVSSDDKLDRFVFNPSNWQIENSGEKNFAGFIIVIDDFFCFDSAVFGDLHLKKEAPFYVFEKSVGKNLSEDGKRQRIGVLRELGLVQANILVKQIPDFLVWEARMERKRTVCEINLLDKEKHPRAYNWARKLWRDMAKEYRKYGFKVVSGPDSEIVSKLKSSKNPPDDLGKLKMGWGVEIKNPSCGCQVKVSLDGDFNWVYFCGDETHHTIGQGRTLSRERT